MEKDYHESKGLEDKYRNVKKFQELFVLLHSAKPDSQYEEAYERAAELAKKFVDMKSKSSWNQTNFEIHIKEKYPEISRDFIDALKRCIENYNPVVNIPTKPLWE